MFELYCMLTGYHLRCHIEITNDDLPKVPISYQYIIMVHTYIFYFLKY